MNDLPIKFDPTKPDHAWHLGYLTALLYVQADNDSKAIQKPVTVARLPAQLDGLDLPFSVPIFEAACDWLEGGEARIVEWNIGPQDPPDQFGERSIQITGSEGYWGEPEGFKSTRP